MGPTNYRTYRTAEIPHRDLKIPHRTAPAQICVFFQKFQNLQFCKQLFLKQKS